MVSLAKNSLVFICFILSAVGLGLIYIAAINIQPALLSLEEVDSQLIGRSVKTSGYISYKKIHPEGHVFLTISENGRKIQVPLFAGFMNALNGNGLTENDLKKGVKISVSGLVGEYKGQLQIIPRKPDDVEILGE